MAILWAEHVTKNTAKEENGVFQRVREYFSEEELFVSMPCLPGQFSSETLEEVIGMPAPHGGVEAMTRKVALQVRSQFLDAAANLQIPIEMQLFPVIEWFLQWHTYIIGTN